MKKSISILIILALASNSCKKETPTTHYESFTENKKDKTDAKTLTIPLFLVEKVLPKKYEKYKPLLKKMKSVEVFVSTDDNKEFDKELTTALKYDYYKLLLSIISKGEMISIHYKKSEKSKELHDFVIYVNDPEEKMGVNITTEINPEDLAEILKNTGTRNIHNIQKIKNILKSMIK